jgi:RNA polymerase sigma-70 factor (ECF subfamily)
VREVRPPVSDDATLVARTLAGDQSAFAGLVERYQGEVYHLALRYTRSREDAEDLTQEAFLRAFRALASYDPARPFGAWLYSITARLCIDHHRRRKVRPVSLTRPEEGTSAEEREWEFADPTEGPEARLERRDEATRLSRLIDRLSPDYRLAILLRHAQDLSYEEIAEATGVPLGTVKARIHRARNQLRAWLEGKERPPAAERQGREPPARADEPAAQRPAARGISPASQRSNPKSRRGMHPDPPVPRREDR